MKRQKRFSPKQNRICTECVGKRATLEWWAHCCDTHRARTPQQKGFNDDTYVCVLRVGRMGVGACGGRLQICVISIWLLIILIWFPTISHIKIVCMVIISFWRLTLHRHTHTRARVWNWLSFLFSLSLTKDICSAQMMQMSKRV